MARSAPAFVGRQRPRVVGRAGRRPRSPLLANGVSEHGQAALPPFPVGGFAVRREVAVGEVHDRVAAVGDEHHLHRAAPGGSVASWGIPQVKITRWGGSTAR